MSRLPPDRLDPQRPPKLLRPGWPEVLGPLLAALCGVAGAYLLAAWLDCSTAEGTALCLAPVAMPAPLRRLHLSWLLWRLRRAEARVRRIKHQQLLGAARRVEAEDDVLRLRRRATGR